MSNFFIILLGGGLSHPSMASYIVIELLNLFGATCHRCSSMLIDMLEWHESWSWSDQTGHQSSTDRSKMVRLYRNSRFQVVDANNPPTIPNMSLTKMGIPIVGVHLIQPNLCCFVCLWVPSLKLLLRPRRCHLRTELLRTEPNRAARRDGSVARGWVSWCSCRAVALHSDLDHPSVR